MKSHFFFIIQIKTAKIGKKSLLSSAETNNTPLGSAQQANGVVWGDG
ncbi:MAG: hypothetical protein SAK29_05710 [Scytonema sp. PMC 1069.18]|nr:hypothetical protein [Scytonema sp. PMC 1069.18]